MRAIELLERFALDKVEFIGAGRSGPAHWRCRGCRPGASPGGILENPPSHLRKYMEFHNWRDRAGREALSLMEHGPRCVVVEALHIVDEARRATACRECGCTEEHACMTDDGPCRWAEPGLCSACA